MNLENLVVSKGKKTFKKTKPASMRYVKGMQKLKKPLMRKIWSTVLLKNMVLWEKKNSFPSHLSKFF